MITLRVARENDAGALAAIAERTFRDTFAASNTAADMDAHCASAYGPDIQLGELRDPRWITFLAENGTELIGFAQLRLSRPVDGISAERPCELYRIYVDRAWHGRGVAQRLMNEVRSHARREQADWIWLGVWERNLKAQAFYAKCGFQEAGEHTFMVGSDAQRDLILASRIE
jgi:ribosomal protein S18 acetylase RimI-like enzyme